MIFMTTVLAPHLVAQRAAPQIPSSAPLTPQVNEHAQRSQVSPTPPPSFNMSCWENELRLTSEEKEKFKHLGYDGQPLSTIAMKHVIHDGEMGFKLLRWERLVYEDEKHHHKFHS
jgi:hypothetical protein